MKKKITPSTSWEKVKDWYDGAVGREGHYYHRNLILPQLLKDWNLPLSPSPDVLDLACGQGVLGRAIPPHIPYTGIDASSSLIQLARQYDPHPLHQYLIGDITKALALKKKKFSHISIILALQNLEHPQLAISQAARHLREDGILTLVINHPFYRIPRQSSWGYDESKKLQFRRIDSYMSSLKIPIQTHPGSISSAETFTFHWPLSLLSHWIGKENLVIKAIDEWCSDKVSTGAKAKVENRARSEFPLFMAIHAGS